MRLAIYSDDPYRRENGAVSSVMPFGLFLAALGQHVDRLILLGRLHPRPGADGERLPSSVTFVALPWWEDMSRLGGLLAALPGSMRRFWLTLEGVDAVWLFGPSPLGVAFALLAALRGRRVVLGVRMDYPEYVRHRHPGQRSLYLVARGFDAAWRLLGRFAPTVVVGAALAERYRHARRLLPASISLVSAADVLERPAPPPNDGSESLAVLTVGRVDAEKNSLMLADVLAELRSHDERWRLVVCGDGPLLNALGERLEALGIADHAELCGFVRSRDRLRALYRQADMFLHVSWTEGVPQVLFEAFAAGLPTVATDVGGVSEASGGDAALLVAPGDALAAAAALQRVMADPALRARLSAAGLSRAREHTREAGAARVAAFIADGIASRSR